jgi:two-component system phosphate regulon response regulator PhoB
VVVLDLMLPGVSGYDVLAELRRLEETRDVGVILLTARREEVDRVRGLSLGADDYLTKPFSPHELTLRVGALLRRIGAPAVAGGSTLVAGPVTIDRSAHRVALDGQDLNLTATEYKLLLTLVERRGRVQTRPQLLETVWDAHPEIQTRTVDMHVQRLRSKLGEAGEMIETVRGFGYRFKGAEKSAKAK